MVSQRALDVLKVIVQDYVDSKEPVGSKSIADRHGFGVSAPPTPLPVGSRPTRVIECLWISWQEFGHCPWANETP